MSTPWSSKPTLVGTTVVLRPFTADDVEAMGPILADPVVLALTGSVHTTAEAHAHAPVLDEEVRRELATRAHSGDCLDLAVVETATNRCVGEVVLNDWRRANQAITYRIHLGPTGRGRGLGTQATALILDHAFTTSDLHRISLDVFATNPAAIAMYQRAGFTTEGRRREAFVFDDQRIDVIPMAILRPQWAAQPRA